MLRMWLEFGVHTGGTLRITAAWRAAHCGSGSPPVHGFDTFTGLPEDWDGQYKKVLGKEHSVCEDTLCLGRMI